MPWVEPNWDGEFKEFELMARRGHVDNATKAFNTARRSGYLASLSLDDPLWESMSNTTSGKRLTRSAAIVEAAANGHRIEPIFEAFDRNKDVQIPIVMLREDGSYYKVAGNHRLMACRALGVQPIVWLFEYPPVLESEGDEMTDEATLRTYVRETVACIIKEGTDGHALVLKGALLLPVERPEYDKSAFAGKQDITELSSGKYHITLIGVRTLKPHRKEIENFWSEIVKNTPRPPVPQFDPKPRRATRDGKETWFLQVVNQSDLQSYVERIENVIREHVPEYEGLEDRFFHISIANNRGGNPFESIGDINEDDVKESDRDAQKTSLAK